MVAAFKPKIVLTAPDGQQLWIDPVSAPGDDAGPSLWPAGFKVSLKFGEIPTTDPAVTPSAPAFLANQSATLAAAPGPGCIPWGYWVAGLSIIALLPYAPLLLRRK